MRPLHQYIVIDVEKESDVSKSGIIIATKEKPSQMAKVLELSDQIDDIKVGDTIIVDKYAPLDVTIGEEVVTIVSYPDVYLVVTE